MNGSATPDLSDRIQKIVAEEQKLPRERVTPEATFEELGIDSLDGIHLLFALENEFKLSIPDDAVKQVKNVRELTEGIAQLIEMQSGGAAEEAGSSA